MSYCGLLVIFLSCIVLAHSSCSQATSCGACLVPANQTCVWCSERSTCIGIDGVCAGGLNGTISNFTSCACTDRWRQRGCNNCLMRSDCIWCESGGCYDESSDVRCHRYSTCDVPGITDVDKAFMLAGAVLLAVAVLTVIGYFLFCRGESAEQNHPHNECEEEEDLLAHLKHGTLREHSINDG